MSEYSHPLERWEYQIRRLSLPGLEGIGHSWIEAHLNGITALSFSQLMCMRCPSTKCFLNPNQVV